VREDKEGGYNREKDNKIDQDEQIWRRTARA
jgi:hypothetical protein